MIPSLYEEYLRVLYEAIRNDNVCHFDETLFSEASSDIVALTIKNYLAKGGMSKFIYKKLGNKKDIKY